MVKIARTEFVRRYLWAAITLILVISTIISLVFRVLYLKRQRFQLIFNDDDEENATSDEIYVDPGIGEYKSQVDQILKLRMRIKKINEAQRIQNLDLYAPVNENTVIIVIDVREKAGHFQELLNSFKEVAGISRSLLIFSHDFYDDYVHTLIQTIDFAKTIQIYYPYSTQMHPNIFPGEDKKFCTVSYECKDAAQNVEYRDWVNAQKKHNWWWKMNHVFDYLEITSHYNGYILFLEEDQYVTEDFIYVFKLLSKLMPDDCPQCEMMSLGAYHPNTHQFHVTNGRALIDTFGSTDYHMGIAFNRTFWNKIKAMKTDFCYFNSCNWYDTLVYLGSKTTSGRFQIFASEGPRVFYTGKCFLAWDLPGTEVECTIENKVMELHRFMNFIRRGFYPRGLVVGMADNPFKAFAAKQGGWEDVRDHDLCMFLSSKMKTRFNI